MSCKSIYPKEVIGKSYECDIELRSNVNMLESGNYEYYLQRKDSLYFKHLSFGHKIVIHMNDLPKLNLTKGMVLFFEFTDQK